jgi:hypothetical protein
MKAGFDRTPRERDTVQVTLLDDADRPVAGATVRVVYRPGLDGARELSLGVSDTLGRVRWPVDAGGRAELIVDREHLPVTIRYADPPWQTLTLIALLLVFAIGAIVAGATRSRRPGEAA